MSRPFLTTTTTGKRIAVEIAWGADLSDTDGSGWTWTDITDDVILGDTDLGEGAGITITIGRADFASETQPAELTCTLDNRDASYSLGSVSPNYPNVKRGVPVRVRISADNGATWKTRFQGNATGFTPNWDAETGRWATVTLTASGGLRRMAQGTQPVMSALRRGLMSDPTIRAYWPLEDEKETTVLELGKGQSGDRARVQQRVRSEDGWAEAAVPPGVFASYDNVPSSAPMITMSDMGTLIFELGSDTTGSSVEVSLIVGNLLGITPYQTLPQNYYDWYSGCFLSVITEDGSKVERWDVFAGGGHNSQESYTNKPGNTMGVWCSSDWTQKAAPTSDSYHVFRSRFRMLNLFEGVDYHIGLRLTQSGSTTSWTVFANPIVPNPAEGVDRASFSGDSISSNSNGARVTQVRVGMWRLLGGLGVGHLVIRSPAPSMWYGEQWVRAHLGEQVTARLARLCAENDMGITIVGSNGTGVTATMGQQHRETLLALLRECEITGQGYLFDGLGPGLTYITRPQRVANATGAAALTLDASQGHLMEPFAVLDDESETVNECTVSRKGGATVTYADTDGPMGTKTIGTYSTSVTVNCASDDNLIEYAQMVVERGTLEGYRYPAVSFALEMHPELIPGWLNCLPQSKINVTNIQAIRRQHPAGTIGLMIEGWTEEITAFTWRVTANTTRAARWAI